MASCINRNSAEYQSLKEKAGIPQNIFDVIYSQFQEEYGRSPYLDEIPGANSESFIKKELKIKNESSNINHMLETTDSKTIEEVKFKLNNKYRDKEIRIIPIVNDAFVEIKSRPTDIKIANENTNLINNISSSVIINSINKLIDVYGIKINEVNDIELSSEKWEHLMPRDRMVNAFIYNGEIYINTDRISPDVKIHEMLHLLVGCMRFTNPTLYQKFIDNAEKLPNYKQLASEFNNKTRNDINEEIFIQELAKYLTGQESSLSKLSKQDIYEIKYNTCRILDSMLMGDVSSISLDDNYLYESTFKDLVKYTNSNIMTSKFSGTMNIENSSLHRELNNIKSDLLRTKKLEQICN